MTLAGLDYEQTGSGPPLVMVHAGIADRRMWDDQVAAFSEHYTVIRPDLRGFGKTPPATEPFAISEDLYALIDALGLERASLMGSSIGAGAVLDLALQAPEQVEALVLVGPSVSGRDSSGPAEQALYSAAEAAFERGDLEEAASLEIDVWVAGVGRTIDAVDRRITDRVREMLLATYQHAEEVEDVEPEPPAAGRLGELRAPTLVVVGDHDRSGIQENARMIAAEAARARMVTVPGTAHFPNLEQPARFNQLALEFLADVHAR